MLCILTEQKVTMINSQLRAWTLLSLRRPPGGHRANGRTTTSSLSAIPSDGLQCEIPVVLWRCCRNMTRLYHPSRYSSSLNAQPGKWTSLRTTGSNPMGTLEQKNPTRHSTSTASWGRTGRGPPVKAYGRAEDGGFRTVRTASGVVLSVVTVVSVVQWCQCFQWCQCCQRCQRCQCCVERAECGD